MISLQDYKFNRFSHLMEKYDFDLLILSLPENIEYLTNFRSESHYMINRNENYLIYCPSSGYKAIIASASDGPPIVEFADYTEAFLYGNFQFYIPSPIGFSAELLGLLEYRYASALDALKEALQKQNISGKHIGFDESRTPVTTWKAIEASFPNAKFSPAFALTSEARRVKHPDEISRLKRACNIAEEAVFAACQKIVLGTSESDIGSLCYEEMSRRGASPYFCVVTIDKRSAYCDTRNTKSQAVSDGSIIRLDLGCVFEGYHSDIARTAVYGRPNRRAEYIYHYMVEGQQAAIEKIRDGLSVCDAYKAAMSKAQLGVPAFKRSHVGHGIGIELYDPPFINLSSQNLFEENEVYCVETPYYELDWGGVQVEDTLVVTKEGVKLLSESSRNLIRLGI